jgi:hypothetical protein
MIIGIKIKAVVRRVVISTTSHISIVCQRLGQFWFLLGIRRAIRTAIQNCSRNQEDNPGGTFHVDTVIVRGSRAIIIRHSFLKSAFF